VFSGVYVAYECDEVGDMGSENITTVDVQILLETFLNMPLRSACFIGEAPHQGGNKVLGLGTNVECQIIRICELSDTGLKEFCCILLSALVCCCACRWWFPCHLCRALL
jgi:hypothetical protein